MESKHGTYALLLRARRSQAIQIGRRGVLNVEPGHYIYVGSAFGPGGIRARIDRHWRLGKNNRWHIDYLRTVVTPIGAWISYEARRLEHEWAGTLRSAVGLFSVPEFGSTDCDCETHLFFQAARPSVVTYTDLLEGDVVFRNRGSRGLRAP